MYIHDAYYNKRYLEKDKQSVDLKIASFKERSKFKLMQQTRDLKNVNYI